MINNSINRYLGTMCYPFTCTDLIENDWFAEFYQANSKKKEQIKKKITKKVIGFIQERYMIESYDEIKMLLEKFFFYETNYQSVYECTYATLSRLSNSLLSKLDGKLVYKYWVNEHDSDVLGGFAEKNKMLLFHSLNRHIPLDLMAIIYIIENNTQDINQLHNFYGQIIVADLQLDQLLELGVAENHMHSGASMPFLSMWNMIMNPLTKKDEETYRTLFWKDTLYIEGNQLWGLVFSASIIRFSITILQIIGLEQLKNTSTKLYSFLQCFTGERDITGLYDQMEQCSERELYGMFLSLWNEVSRFVTLDDEIIRTLYQVPPYLKTSEENIFLYQTVLYLNRKDDTIEKKYIQHLFLQYIRIKNTFFAMMVQQKTIKGLDYFQSQFYSKNSSLTRIINRSFWETVMREQFQNRNLKKIEFRMSVNSKNALFRKNIKSFLESYLSILKNDYCVQDEDGKYVVVNAFPRVGIVFSLLKREDTIPQEKCYLDGYINEEKLQFKSLQMQYMQQIDNIQELRNENSELSKYIVGLDAASLENATPVWVFSPIYEYARDSMKDPLVIGNNLSYYQSLNFTFHAGEDFRHILTGVRRIDEAVTHLKFHAGDRIGHGIALGLDAEKWYQENPVVILPQIELLEDYLWAYHILSNAEQDINATIMAYIEKRIFDLAKEIYEVSNGIKTEVLVDAYLNMFSRELQPSCNEEEIHENFCKHIDSPTSLRWDVRNLCIARNCAYYTKRMNKPIHLKVTDKELEIAKIVQQIVQKKIGQMGIVIEINPSSNVAISSMDSLYENQIYSINRFMQQNSNVMVCINSDDPSVFNTNVSNELAYIFNTLLQKGICKEDAIQWIEKLRINGITSSFIRRKDSDQKVLDELIKLVNIL